MWIKGVTIIRKAGCGLEGANKFSNPDVKNQ